MADKLIRLALTRLDAVQSKVPLWAGILAQMTHQSRWTQTMSVVLPARRFVLAPARVLAILTVFTNGTRFATLWTCPSRRTIAGARHIIALAAVLATALEGTISTIPALPTRMLTCGARITRWTL